MPRPSITGMLDRKMRIWRPTTTQDSIAVEERQYTALAVVDCALNRPSVSEVDTGPGMAPVGQLRWYGRASIDVQPRDVCEIADGAEAGQTFEVNAPPVRPMGHHTQVDCIEWNGQLPDHS